MIFWRVTLKLFSFSLVSLLARNPGDATAHGASSVCVEMPIGGSERVSLSRVIRLVTVGRN